MNLDELETKILPIPCPEVGVWERYLQGEISDADAISLDFHLEQCSDCNSQLERIEVSLSNPVTSQLELEEQEILAAAIGSAQRGTLASNAPHANATKAIHLETKTDNLGPYRLIESIATGGMGRVFLAEHTKLNKRVALKLLPLHIAPAGAVERFEREIQAIGKLSHPTIVHATDAGSDAGYVYLVMEYVDGWDLSQILRSSRSLRITEICEIGRQVALALSYAHHQGMVHRDIKPSNIMLDRQGNLKLLDFGLVLLDRWDSPLGELTTVGQFLGTLDYMAPEQAEKSAAVDHRSDIYSLGATLFRLLTNQLPLAMFPQQSPLEKLRVLSSHAPVRIGTLRSDLPKELCELVDAMLETNPSNRPPNAARVAEKLQSLNKGADLSTLAKELDSIEIPASPPMSGAEPSPLAVATDSSRWGIGRKAFWLAGALLPFLIYFGVTLILEDSSGNLVIESELNELEVKVRREDGTPVKDWNIEQGTSSTKLRSGNYAIEVPTDVATISPQSIALSKGGTVIARISKAGQASQPATESRSTASESTPAASVQSDVPEELRDLKVGGKLVTEYLNNIRTEQSFSAWIKEVDELHKGKINSPYIDQVILQAFETKRSTNSWTIPYWRLDSVLPPEMLDDKIVREIKARNGIELFRAMRNVLFDAAVFPEFPRDFWKKSLEYPKTFESLEKALVEQHSNGQVVRLPRGRVILDYDFRTLQFFKTLSELQPKFPRLVAVLLEPYMQVYVDTSERQAITLGDLFSASGFLNSREQWDRWNAVSEQILDKACEQKHWELYFSTLQSQILASKAVHSTGVVGEDAWKMVTEQLNNRVADWMESEEIVWKPWVNSFYLPPKNNLSIHSEWVIHEKPLKNSQLVKLERDSDGAGSLVYSRKALSDCLLDAFQFLPPSVRPNDALKELHGYLSKGAEAVNEDANEWRLKRRTFWWHFAGDDEFSKADLDDPTMSVKSIESVARWYYIRRIEQILGDSQVNADASFSRLLRILRGSEALDNEFKNWFSSDARGGVPETLDKLVATFDMPYKSSRSFDVRPQSLPDNAPTRPRSNVPERRSLSDLNRWVMIDSWLPDQAALLSGREMTPSQDSADVSGFNRMLDLSDRLAVEFIWEEGCWKINKVSYKSNEKGDGAIPEDAVIAPFPSSEK